MGRSAAEKQAINAAKFQAESRTLAKPWIERGAQYDPYMEKATQAAELPAMRSGWDAARRQLAGKMARQGMGQSGIAVGQQSKLNQDWGQQLADAQHRQAGLYGQMAGQAAQVGRYGEGMQLAPYQTWDRLFGGRAAQDWADEQAKAQGERDMWGNIIEGGIDVGAAFLTGGATIPASLAKYAQKYSAKNKEANSPAAQARQSGAYYSD